MGAAAFAATAVGLISHPSEAAKLSADKETVFLPDAKAEQMFEEAFKNYTALFEMIHDFETLKS